MYIQVVPLGASLAVATIRDFFLAKTFQLSITQTWATVEVECCGGRWDCAFYVIGVTTALSSCYRRLFECNETHDEMC